MRKLLPVLVLLLLGPVPDAAALTPQDYYQAGLKLCAQGQYEQAVTYFKLTVQLDPSNWRAYQALGTSYYHLNLIPDALAAMDQSLALNPDNPSLRQFEDSIQSANPGVVPLTGATPIPGTPGTATTAPSGGPQQGGQPEVLSWPRILRFNFSSAKKKDQQAWWLKVYGGYNHSDMSALVNAAQSWNVFYQTNGYKTVSSSENVNGFMGGAELGLMLDKANAFSLALDGVFNGQFQAEANNGPQAAVIQTIDPFLVASTLNYYHYFYQKNNRFYIGLGAGYGEAIVHYAGPFGPSQAEAITDLFGGGFVGNLQVGEELELSGNFTLEFAITERFAQIPQVSANMDGEPVVLTTVPVGLNFLWNESNSYKSTPLDFTGPDVKLSFDFYF